MPKPVAAAISEKVAKLTLEGKSVREIADITGLSPSGVGAAKLRARKRGLLPERTPASKLKRYNYLRSQGAAPLIGKVGAVIDQIADEDTDKLLTLLNRDDETLAHMLVRVALERANGPE